MGCAGNRDEAGAPEDGGLEAAEGVGEVAEVVFSYVSFFSVRAMAWKSTESYEP